MTKKLKSLTRKPLIYGLLRIKVGAGREIFKAVML